MRRVHACTYSSACPWKLGQTSSDITSFHIGISSHQHTFWQFCELICRSLSLKHSLMFADRYPYWFSTCGMYLHMASNIGPSNNLSTNWTIDCCKLLFFGNNHGTWYSTALSDGVCCHRSLTVGCAIRMRLRLMVRCGIRLRLCLTSSRAIRMRLYEINRHHQIH